MLASATHIGSCRCYVEAPLGAPLTAIPQTHVAKVKLPHAAFLPRIASGTFPSPAHAEGHWLAASGAIKICCATDSSKYCMARQAYCILWQT